MLFRISRSKTKSKGMGLMYGEHGGVDGEGARFHPSTLAAIPEARCGGLCEEVSEGCTHKTTKSETVNRSFGNKAYPFFRF
ncbi:unnamed protein product [Linum trigynum]|uniref:Uncharacterized protein n=1 Tax=Linum trigynum TaxID=586398 RepID=A0AAV2FUE2_9ROSI